MLILPLVFLTIDGGWSPMIGLQELVANHRKRRSSRARVVSVTEKAPQRRQVGVLVPQFASAFLSRDSKDALWAKFLGQVLHGSATTTDAVRRAIQYSQEGLRALARRYGVNPKTIAKWKGRTSIGPDRAKNEGSTRACKRAISTPASGAIRYRCRLIAPAS